MSEWRNFVKDVAQKQGIKYNEALKIASPLWKEHKSGKSGDTMTIQPMDEEPKEVLEYERAWAEDNFNSDQRVLIARMTDKRKKEVLKILGLEEQNEPSESEPKVKSVYDSPKHPYYKDFLHIRKRQKGEGIWGDIWNGISSVLKPAMAIVGGPLGALASTLVPTITKSGGVNMLGQNL